MKVSIVQLPAQLMQLRFPKQVITVLADTIQPGKDTFIVYTLTLNIDKGPFTQRVSVQDASVR